MADGFHLVVDTADLRRALRSIGDASLTKELRQANKAGADVVARAALPAVPVRSGRLRASIRATGSQKDGQVKAGTAKVDYAAAIHWGRGSGNVAFRNGSSARRQRGGPIKGRPFLWDAADRHRQQVVDIYEAAIRRLLDHIRS